MIDWILTGAMFIMFMLGVIMGWILWGVCGDNTGKGDG